MALLAYLSGGCADLRDAIMKLNPAWIFGSGGIYHDQYPFSLSHIPRIHLWSGHYSCPFPEQFQRGWAELLWPGCPEQLQRWGLGPGTPLSKIGHPIFNTDADPAWILARGGYLPRLIFIFTVPYPLYSLVVRALFMPFSRAVPAGGYSDGSDPPYFVGLSSPDPLAIYQRGCRCRPPQGGGRSRPSDPCRKA